MAKKIDYASLYTRRKDGIYCGTYTDEYGRHYVYSKDPEVLWHKLNDPKPEREYTFSEAADEWDKAHSEDVGWKTEEAYRAPLRRLKSQYGTRPLEDITSTEINALLKYYGQSGFSRRTVQMHRDILNMIFNHAIVTGHIKSNPCAAVSIPKGLACSQRELPSDEAIDAVKRSGDAPFGLFALICLYAGLRRGEALALRYEDIDRKKNVIHVTKAVEFIGNNPHIKPPKTKSGTRDAVLLDVLEKEIPSGKSGLIFCGEDGNPLTKMQYRRRWADYCTAIGYDITAHQLRHGFATILYEAGIQDKDAQQFMGHSSIQVTRDVYTHIRQSQIDKSLSKLNKFISGDGE